MDNNILVEFGIESKQIIAELEEIVEKMEEDTISKGNVHMVQFSQRIDRIMGASKTISMMLPLNRGLKEIGKITVLCKSMGYKMVQTDAPELVPLFCAFWADTLEALNEVIDHIEDSNKVEKIVDEFIPVIRKRLEWLASKIQLVVPAEKLAPNELFNRKKND